MPSLSDIAAQLSAYDANALPVHVAQEFIQRSVQPVTMTERVGLRASLGRVLAADILSPFNVPAHHNSAMDGYALRGAELSEGSPRKWRIAKTCLAGQVIQEEVARFECVRIMTGAWLPIGCDTIVPQELVQIEGDSISVPIGIVTPGDHCRLAGEDLAQGEPALRRGRRLRPADLGLLASLGQAEVNVFRRLRVAFFSTGNELRSIGEPLQEGCLYDSNRYTLWAMLERLGLEALDMGVVPDDPRLLEVSLRQAAQNADVVITTGGVGVGDADHTKQMMNSLGEVLLWQIAMRPGRSMAIGRVKSNGHCAMLFGLPGNPVAVMVSFYALVRDALLAMCGATPQPLVPMQAASVTPIRKKPGRTEYQRGVFSRAPTGQWQVALTGSQGSGVLRSMSEAHGLIVLHHDQGNVEAGELVDVFPFDGLI